jgi:hypothetical protein
MLNPNVIADIDDDVDNEIIPLVLEFGMIEHFVIDVFQETLI